MGKKKGEYIKNINRSPERLEREKEKVKKTGKAKAEEMGLCTGLVT